MTTEDNVSRIKELVYGEKKIVFSLNSLFNSQKNSKDDSEKKIIDSQIEEMKNSLKKINDSLLKNLEQTNVRIPLIETPKMAATARDEFSDKGGKLTMGKKEKISPFEKEIIERLKKEKEKKKEEKTGKKSGDYTKLAEKYFSKLAMSLIKQKRFKNVGRDLSRANLNFTLISYVSVLLFTTTLAFIGSFLIFIFLMFFNLSPTLPIITMVTENFGIRFLEIFWIFLVIPAGTFLFMYGYPSLEKKSLGGKIDAELPFAAIHMAAIAGSLIDPTKIFAIIASTKEYPNLEKEFNKLLNEINIYGYDLVTALKDSALNSPSAKLAELLNGLATTITSGGSLFEFFEKRSQSLLFEYRLDKEKNTKTAENFMDIYISVVIAAPMIFMLLLMMMKISGLGVSLSTGVITLLIVGGTSLINVFFIIFLQVKQASTA